MVAKKLWFADDRIYIETEDGRILWQSILYYQRLKNATDKERDNFELGAFGIHWDDIDEDVSYESFEYPNPEPIGISKIFLTHPELNASAIARRLGMKQSLLAQYINGTKKTSKVREVQIVDAIKQVGEELASV
jgi:hypothetical protein